MAMSPTLAPSPAHQPMNSVPAHYPYGGTVEVKKTLPRLHAVSTSVHRARMNDATVNGGHRLPVYKRC